MPGPHLPPMSWAPWKWGSLGCSGFFRDPWTCILALIPWNQGALAGQLKWCKWLLQSLRSNSWPVSCELHFHEAYCSWLLFSYPHQLLLLAGFAGNTVCLFLSGHQVPFGTRHLPYIWSCVNTVGLLRGSELICSPFLQPLTASCWTTSFCVYLHSCVYLSSVFFPSLLIFKKKKSSWLVIGSNPPLGGSSVY